MGGQQTYYYRLYIAVVSYLIVNIAIATVGLMPLNLMIVAILHL